MTNVAITMNGESIKKILIEGHSEFEISGRDICCAAISTTTTYTLNAIFHFNKSDLIDVVIKETIGLTHIRVKDTSDDVVQKFMQLLVLHLKEIKKEFPNNIEIKEK